jgi:hypothetical protein
MEKKIINYFATIADTSNTFAKQATARSELIQKIGKKHVQYERIPPHFRLRPLPYFFPFLLPLQIYLMSVRYICSYTKTATQRFF